MGRFAEDLPEAGVEAMLVDLRVAEHFMKWIRSRHVGDMSPIADWPSLAQLVQ
jgi:hypothetical protein